MIPEILPSDNLNKLFVYTENKRFLPVFYINHIFFLIRSLILVIN